jgi:peroxiredoxin
MKLSMSIITAGLFFSIAGCGASDLHLPLEIGDPAPPFELIDVCTQQEVNRDSLIGKPAVALNFWSISCAACMKEIEDLQRLHREGQAVVVGIAVDGTPEQLKKIVEAQGIDYPVLAGNEGLFAQYDGYSTPYTLVLDSKLAVRRKFFGRMDIDELNETLTSIENGK